MTNVIYVAGRYRGENAYEIHENILHAERASLDLWKEGYVPITPHKLTEHFQGVLPDEVWLNGCLELLKRCDAIFLLRGWQQSKGSVAEYELAKELGLEVIFEPGVNLF